jgi:transcription antitermination factor NusG
MEELDFHSAFLSGGNVLLRGSTSQAERKRGPDVFAKHFLLPRDTMSERSSRTSNGAPDQHATNNQEIWIPKWYALYTRSRFEKKMLGELTDRNIEVFLPMREVLSRWKDRKKRVWLPLFPGYIFVNHINTPENRYKILNIPGAVRFVGHEGRAEPVPEEQIQSVRKFLESKIAMDPYPYLKKGSRVEIVAGPLKGIQGILVKKRGRFRFVLQVDLIRQAVSVEIDASDVRPL